jgi:uncharacterized protein YjaZ
LVFSCIDENKKINTINWIVLIGGYYLGYQIIKSYLNPSVSISKESMPPKVTF